MKKRDEWRLTGDPVVRWDSYETLDTSNNSTTTGASTTDDEDERGSHSSVSHHRESIFQFVAFDGRVDLILLKNSGTIADDFWMLWNMLGQLDVFSGRNNNQRHFYSGEKEMKCTALRDTRPEGFRLAVR